MITKTDFINDLHFILNPEIGHCPLYKKYYINEIWSNEISMEYFDELSYSFEKKIIDNISIYKNPKALIVELNEIIWGKIDWYAQHKINKFSFYKTIKNKIIEIENPNGPPLEDKYTIDFIRNYDFNIDCEIDDLFWTIYNFKTETNNFSDELDLEKTKLINALQIHYENLKVLYYSLDKIVMNFEDIDFQNYPSSYPHKNLYVFKLKWTFPKRVFS